MNNAMIAETKPAAARADQLQFLRFLAFLNIYIAHAEVWNFFGYPASHCAAYCVSFFFILSGTVTGYSGFGKDISLTPAAMGRYMWKKLKKLYPLYFLTMLLPVLYSQIPNMIAVGDFAAARPQLIQLAKNLLLIQSWFPVGYFSYNGVGWFLSTLMFLNLFCLPVLYLLNRFCRTVKSVPALVLCVGGIVVAVVGYCYATQSYDMDYWQYVLPPARLGEFLCGIVMGYGIRLLMPWVQTWKGKQVLFTVLELGAVVLWVIFLRRPGNYWMNRIVSWLIPNLVLLCVFTFGHGWLSRLFRLKMLVRLGDVSFECFLLHNLLIVGYVQCNPGASATVSGQVFSFFYCLIFTVLLSLLLNKGGVKPRKTK